MYTNRARICFNCYVKKNIYLSNYLKLTMIKKDTVYKNTYKIA